MWKTLQPKPSNLRVWQLALLLAVFAVWHLLTSPGLLPPMVFENDQQAAFFFGGLWLALQPMASALLEPYIKAMNAMPRIILAPIFAVWFGLGIASKVALGVTLVFFIVFFNVYQGVKEVSPVILANARMLGASPRQLLRHVYLPSATSWVFSSLHTSVGLAFVGAVVGEYLGSASGVGYLIHQAEGVFDINTVMAGILVLTGFALALDGAVGWIEARLMVWRPSGGETEKL
ncbi:MAG: ABC transporter permease [Betaproteobacteria bacterium]|nr:ABC transporter permease [Betaproteobacteria bacterium]